MLALELERPLPPSSREERNTRVPEGYSLYLRTVRESSGNERPIYFFSKIVPASGEAATIPPGYEVVLNRKTGPTLRKRRF